MTKQKIQLLSKEFEVSKLVVQKTHLCTSSSERVLEQVGILNPSW